MVSHYQVEMEIAGATALWMRPDTGDSPVSYPAPTYSAVKALFESVLWGPAVEVIPRKVEICAPLRWHSYVTNYGGPLRKANTANFQLFATVLTDVCYRIYAEVVPYSDKGRLPDSAKTWDKRTTSPGHAYQSIFNRRLKKGQSYTGLFLGWREFTLSYFGPFREETRVFEELPDIYIPSLLRQVFSKGYNTAFEPEYDVDLVIHQGVLVFPEKESKK